MADVEQILRGKGLIEQRVSIDNATSSDVSTLQEMCERFTPEGVMALLQKAVRANNELYAEMVQSAASLGRQRGLM